MDVMCRSADDIEWLLRALAKRSGEKMPGRVNRLVFPMMDLWMKGLGVAVIVVVPERRIPRG
jgi:hypothetical protein